MIITSYSLCVSLYSFSLYLFIQVAIRKDSTRNQFIPGVSHVWRLRKKESRERNE
jgi:hypothetical protein